MSTKRKKIGGGLSFIPFIVASLVVSVLVTAALVALGMDAAKASLYGTLSIVFVGAADIYFGSIRPHRQFMKRNNRILALVQSGDKAKWVEATYLLGLNRLHIDGDDSTLKIAVKLLIEAGVDPATIDKGEA